MLISLCVALRALCIGAYNTSQGVHILPHCCIILLHEPFADLSDPSNMSAKRILTAARAVLSFVYLLTGSSIDWSAMLHVGYSPTSSWMALTPTAAGLFLVRVVRRNACRFTYFLQAHSSRLRGRSCCSCKGPS